MGSDQVDGGRVAGGFRDLQVDTVQDTDRLEDTATRFLDRQHL
jgi:hypothetical protein